MKMLKKFINAFILGFKNIKAHFLHTLLSVLGVVIGVAALVGILSLIDSLENYVGKQISNTTDLESIGIVSQKQEKIAGTWVKKESYEHLDYEHFTALITSLSLPTKKRLLYFNTGSRLVAKQDKDTIETLITAVSSTENYLPDSNVIHGRVIGEQDLKLNKKVVLVNEDFAKKLTKNGNIKDALGKYIVHNDNDLEVIGVVKIKQKKPKVFIPITLFSAKAVQENAPTVELVASSIDQVPILKKEIETWLAKNYKNGKTDFLVSINEGRVKQAAQGFLLAKVIGGLIVGISVLVGGIGIMNVLLISVTERTSEIGIQKAVGASRTDIIFQFLSESLCISLIGSGLGLLLGMIGTLAVTPLMHLIIPELTDFQAHFTWGTLFVVGTIAIVIGIIFGTYPAMKAANLDPVVAIRKE